MGDIVTVGCSCCTYQKDFQLGTGILYGELSHYLVTSRLSGKAMQDELLGRMESGEYTLCREQLYRCPGCGTLCARFYGEVRGRRRTYQTRHRCHRCNRYLEMLEPAAINGSSCPRCEEGALYYRISGSWD